MRSIISQRKNMKTTRSWLFSCLSKRDVENLTKSEGDGILRFIS